MRNDQHLISVAELASIIDADDVRIVDCRFSLLEPGKGREAYAAGHIPGAVYAHLDDDLAAPVTDETGRHPLPEPGVFSATLRRWGISGDTRVVAYDDASGGLAARLWWMLRWLGHERVALLDGGYAAWSASGMPTSQDVPAPAEGSFVGVPNDDMIIDVDELMRRLDADPSFLLVDARDAPRFRGEVEPIDATAGHVPGAVNRPVSDNLGNDGLWRSPDELAAGWRRLPAPTGAGEWAVMCGSGVTACHLALSATLAGLPRPRLYVGSWSEWIRDPERGIALGEADAGGVGLAVTGQAGPADSG